MKAHEILNTAAGHLEERGKVYDKPEGERSMPNVVAAFSAITGVTMTAEQGWLFMTLVKSVRSQQGDYKGDNYEDGAAYFALMGEQASQDRASPFPDTHLDFDEERVDRVANSHGDGEHYDDMTNPANWLPGDLVEFVAEESQYFTKGRKYLICGPGGQGEWLTSDNDGSDHYLSFPHAKINFRFHSRPSADGWIDWAGGECPCDENSRVEVEMRNGVKDSGLSAGVWQWKHFGNQRRHHPLPHAMINP
tara:strand:+ start:1486 stop:2232 length:747 start_codon:yes stop_codon:yes gene_type:complete